MRISDWSSDVCSSDLIAAAIDALKTFKFEELRGQTMIRREPIGVCAMITPWNWPMNQVAVKVLPALATGCTMVLKPPQLAPYSAQIFAEVDRKSTRLNSSH